MVSRRIRTRKQVRPLRWALVAFLGVHFLSLCTISPRVHADLLRQATQDHQTSARHCSHPSAAPPTAGPLVPDPDRTALPMCCELMGASKATIDSPLQTTPAPLLALTCSLPDSGLLAEEVQSLHRVQALHSSRPPPLYLLHTALLI